MNRTAEASRYRRYARAADRLRRMTQGKVRTYRGRYPHAWIELARGTETLI